MNLSLRDFLITDHIQTVQWYGLLQKSQSKKFDLNDKFIHLLNDLWRQDFGQLQLWHWVWFLSLCEFHFSPPSLTHFHFLNIFSVLAFFSGQNSGKLKTHCTGHWSPSLTASLWTWKLCGDMDLFGDVHKKCWWRATEMCPGDHNLRSFDRFPWQHVDTFSRNYDTDLNAKPVSRYFWN